MRAAGARANRRRSEIEAVIDGEQRILCLMLDALAELATAFSADNLVGLAERFSRGQLKAADMIVSSAPVFAAASESAAPYFSNGPHGRFLITRIEDGDARRVEAREFATSVDRSAGTVTGAKPSGEGGSNLFSPVVQLMDLPRFDGSDPSSFARGAAFAKPWTTIGLSSSATSEGYKGRVLLDRPARIGSLTCALAAGVVGRFDWSLPLELDLPYGGRASAPATSVLNGANLMALLSVNGAWEVLAFREAEEVESGRWALHGLLRALAGTEDAMLSGAAVGSAVVLLDEAVKPLGLGSDEMDLRLNWIAETASSAGKAGPFAFEGGLRALTPLAPVHIRCARNDDGVKVPGSGAGVTAPTTGSPPKFRWMSRLNATASTLWTVTRF